MFKQRLFGLIAIFALVGGLLPMTVGVVLAAAPPAPHFNGFESANDVDTGTYPDEAMYSVSRVASGSSGFPSAAGSWHATAAASAGSFTRYGGYSSVFPAGGYSTSIDIYLDTAASPLGADVRLDWSSAINDPSGSHRRDFIFSVGTDGTGGFVMSASNNAPGWPANPERDPLTITTTGWYTFEHSFRDAGAGVLAVDMSVLAGATVLKTWTLSDSSDVIGTTVGGNRYGWLVVNEFSSLALDNVTRSGVVQCSAVCYVDAGVGSDANGGTSAADAKKTIQAAVDTVSPGGSVIVAAGTYVENIVIPKPLTLTGDSEATTFVKPATSAPNPCLGSSLCGGAASNIILVQADDVTISGFTLDGDNPALTSAIVRSGAGPAADLDARNGIITDYTSGVFSGLDVHDVTVQNIYLRGIYAASGGTFDFQDNTVTNVQGDAYSIAMFAWYGPGVMAHNTVSWANDGISANHSKGIQFLDNTITGSGSGVHTDNAGDGGGVGDVISGNSVSDCKADGYGVWVFVPYLAPTVEDNTVSNCLIGLGAFGGAFSTAPPVTTAFTDNRVDGGGAAGSTGVLVQTGTFGYGNTDVAAEFVHNTIVNNDTGVLVDESPDPWTDPPTTSSTAVAAVTMHYNVIAGNETIGLTTNGAGTIDATNNWWGCSGGPADTANCNGVSSSVDADPWLVDRFALAAGILPVSGSTTMSVDLTSNSDGVHLGDTVPDGTTVLFSTAGGGSVTGGSTTTIGGQASATLNAGSAAGVFEACAEVPETYGAEECIFVAVYDPSAGFVTGGGWFQSPAGALTADPAATGNATFGFVSKYKKGATIPDGSTEFRFKAGDLNFQSSSYEWLVVNKASKNAQFKGTGTINGSGNYGFMIWAADGTPDTFRIKIWDKTTGDAVVYDNGVAQPIGGGSIVVHTK